jgi:hypothetical protein
MALREAERTRDRDVHGSGRKIDMVRLAYMMQFGVSKRTVNCTGVSTLSQCRSDEARRILLGISERFGPDEANQ